MNKFRPFVIKILLIVALIIVGCNLLSVVYDLTEMYQSWVTDTGLRLDESGSKYAEIAYLLIFILLPIVIVFLTVYFSRKTKHFKILTVSLIVLTFLMSGIVLFNSLIWSNKYRTKDFDSYLTYETDIELLASKLMPSKDEFKNANIESYEFYSSGEEIKFIQVKAKYNDDFEQAKKAVEENYGSRDDITYDEEKNLFSIDNELYFYYQVFDRDSEGYDNPHGGSGIFVYSINDKEQTIVYVTLESSIFSETQTEMLVNDYIYPFD